jgi:hypothetical protein
VNAGTVGGRVLSPPLSSQTMVSFRAGGMAGELRRRATPGQVGAIAKRDLSRYYWLLRVTLAGSPVIDPLIRSSLTERVTAALEHDEGASEALGGDLTAVVFACHDVLPDWTPLQLLALADSLERLHRRGKRLTVEALEGVRG